MAGYQPRHDTDPVWYNGTKINHLDITNTGVGVRVTGVFGWDDRPDVRDVRELRPAQAGEFVDDLYLGGRTITIEGEVYGSTWANLQSRKRTLSAIFNPTNDEVLFKIPDPATTSPTTSYSTTGMTGYERVNARVVEAIQFGDTLDPMSQTFQVVLRASDPRVYSDTETSTDSGTTGTGARTVAVHQGGTYDTPPTLTVTGPTGSSWDIAEPTSGLDLDFTGLTVGSGGTVEIDIRERTATHTATYESVRTALDPLVALWMLNETSGTTADNNEGTAALDGTYTGGYTLNQTGPKAGVASVEFNGSTGYVTLTSNSSFDTTSSTVEAWVKFDTLASTQIFYDGLDTVTDKGISIGAISSGTLRISWGNGFSIGSFSPSSTISTGAWYHIVVVTTSNSITTYVNGVLKHTYSLTGVGGPYVALPTGKTVNLGRQISGAAYLDGFLSAVAFYSTNYGASSVADLYAATDATSTINAYDKLDPTTTRWADLGTGSSIYTLSSSGLNTGSKLNVAYRDARL